MFKAGEKEMRRALQAVAVDYDPCFFLISRHRNGSCNNLVESEITIVHGSSSSLYPFYVAFRVLKEAVCTSNAKPR